jgi:hypothetical protein
VASLELECCAHHPAVFVTEPSRIELVRRRVWQLGDRLDTEVACRREPNGLGLDYPRNVTVRQAEQQRRIPVDIGSLNHGATERRTVVSEAPWG